MLSDDENRLVEYIDSKGDVLVDLLRRLVNTDSFSINKSDVDKAGGIIKEYWDAENIPVETRHGEKFGDVLVGRIGDGERPFLLMGHRDTVFPAGEAQARSFKIVDGRGYGPGVNDMKGGVAINAVVMAAFKECLATPPAVVGLVTGDEELASPFSRPIIEEFARGARAVFNSEPARPNGNVVTGRKGARFMRLEVWGKPAHSGVNFFDGASAVEELAIKIGALRSITNQNEGTTLNVGLISGGQTVNTVAPYAVAEIDLRFVDARACEAAIGQIEDIVARSTIAGTRAQLSLRGEFLPMVATEESQKLFNFYRQTAAELGIALDGEFTGSCADSGFTSSQGVPTLCGTGPVGNKSHTPDEYVEIGTIVERAKVLALTIYRMSRM